MKNATRLNYIKPQGTLYPAGGYRVPCVFLFTMIVVVAFGWLFAEVGDFENPEEQNGVDQTGNEKRGNEFPAIGSNATFD